MKAIVKTFNTIRQAVRFQNRLYEQYGTVRLVSAPLHSEYGRYIWNVRK